MSGLGLALQLAGGGLAAFGQFQAYNQAAQISKYNQAVYNQNADSITAAAAANRQAAEAKKRSYLSKMKALYAFRGVNLTGSPLLAMAESASNLEMDIQNQEFNSLLDAQRYRSGAITAGLEAGYYKKAGVTSAISTALPAGAEYIRQTVKPKSKLATEY